MKRAGAVLLLFSLAPGCRREPEAPAAEHKEAAHGSGVHLDKAAQERLGVVVGQLPARPMRPRVEAAGRVVSDPSRVFDLRAPVAGTVRAAKEWLQLGQSIEAPLVVGWIEPRFTPAEHGDLGSRRAQASRDLAAARASSAAANAELERLRKLNEEGKNVSDRAVEEAEARARIEDANRNGAMETLTWIDAGLQPSKALESYPLFFPPTSGGEVVELAGRANESVDAGALIARVERFDSVLARVELPAGVALGPAKAATLVALAHPDRALQAAIVGRAPDSTSQGEAYLVRAEAGDLKLRPGEAVIAWLERDLPEKSGVLVPRAAIVHHAGKAWVYLQTGDETFARQEIALEETDPAGWVTSAPWAPDARAVLGGAASVLSAEILSAAGGGGGEE